MMLKQDIEEEEEAEAAAAGGHNIKLDQNIFNDLNEIMLENNLVKL